MQTTTTSKQFSLKLNDFWKGLLMAVGTPVITILLASLQANSFDIQWKMVATVGLSSLLMYLSKNFFTPSAIVVKDATPEQVKAVEKGTAEVNIDHT